MCDNKGIIICLNYDTDTLIIKLNVSKCWSSWNAISCQDPTFESPLSSEAITAADPATLNAWDSFSQSTSSETSDVTPFESEDDVTDTATMYESMISNGGENEEYSIWMFVDWDSLRLVSEGTFSCSDCTPCADLILVCFNFTNTTPTQMVRTKNCNILGDV